MTLLLLLNACASLVLGVYALHEGLLLWLSLPGFAVFTLLALLFFVLAQRRLSAAE